ncbi:MAG: fumarylacetoacetase [Blastocatellia bacterium]
MSYSINETHDPNLTSWVESANDPDTDFPIQNLPFGLFIPPGPYVEEREIPDIGVAIGDQIVNLTTVSKRFWKKPFVEYIFSDKFDLQASEAGIADSLFALMISDPGALTELRRRLVRLLRADCSGPDREMVEKCLLPMKETRIILPSEPGDYTDFYASIYHATNIGKMFRPDQPLMPNYKWVPIGYHGRSSSIVLSGTPIRRPCGQTMAEGAAAPEFGPSKVLDYELEVGFFIGKGNKRGKPIKITKAENRIFGLCLVNDWSARDIQRWEYQPLGPFLSKSFATTISPWVVTMEALAPFRAPAFKRVADDPAPLEYLDSPFNREQGGFDIHLEVLISTQQMREKSVAPHRLSASNTRDLYWTFAQMLTHHASNGCNLRPGDLMASGTVSGPTKESRGCLMELTERGAQPVTLPGGEVRRFLQDGDEVILRGYCEREGFRRIGFGECRGVVLPAAS